MPNSAYLNTDELCRKYVNSHALLKKHLNPIGFLHTTYDSAEVNRFLESVYASRYLVGDSDLETSLYRTLAFCKLKGDIEEHGLSLRVCSDIWKMRLSCVLSQVQETIVEELRWLDRDVNVDRTTEVVFKSSTLPTFTISEASCGIDMRIYRASRESLDRYGRIITFGKISDHGPIKFWYSRYMINVDATFRFKLVSFNDILNPIKVMLDRELSTLINRSDINGFKQFSGGS
jgi:hypothetical protein